MSNHTPGQWRWELNLKSKHVELCGGVPQFDLTVMDFVRWGMGGATPRFREDRNGLNIMKPVHRFAAVCPGREHHASWFQLVDHPDARLIEAAPELLRVVKMAKSLCEAVGIKCPPGMEDMFADLWESSGTIIAKVEDGK